ncbi:metal ABC transporter solute-binding protein, Zn/Mn family [Dongia deserti]|uniref:metal ABC transporter solute-binding protein, Zn/Mn family n=1 Tax=Dongia deserti TaxID=2268030 RepID=UPI000E659236|nr:zinc ABC transporter substrate-binding protein [Dongia deserti]
MRRLVWVAGLLAMMAAVPGVAWSQEKLAVVATFSILGDLTQRIGGDHVQVLTLVGPNGDAHVFQPGPKESAALGKASVLIANGLGFEPWLHRLEESSGFKGKLLVATEGITPLAGAEEHEGEEEEHEGEEAHEEHHDHGGTDPHAFQNLSNALVYVTNIAKGLSEAAPAHAADFKLNADKLSAEIAALDAQLKADFAAIPQERRRVLTSHDAFQYFGRAYGIEFISVQGVSTEAEASAEDLAKIVRQARDGHLSAIFLENMSDPRLAETVAQESGIRVGGELYADALSDPTGPAPDYLSLVRYNAKQLLAAMQ